MDTQSPLEIQTPDNKQLAKSPRFSILFKFVFIFLVLMAAGASAYFFFMSKDSNLNLPKNKTPDTPVSTLTSYPTSYPKATPGAEERTESRKGNIINVWENGAWILTRAGLEVGEIFSTPPGPWEAGGRVIEVSEDSVTVQFGERCTSDFSLLERPRNSGKICGQMVFQIPPEAKIIYIPAYEIIDEKVLEEFVSKGSLQKIKTGDWIEINAEGNIFKKGGGEVIFVTIIQ